MNFSLTLGGISEWDSILISQRIHFVWEEFVAQNIRCRSKSPQPGIWRKVLRESDSEVWGTGLPKLIDPSWNCGSALEVCSLCLGLCGLVDVVAILLAVGSAPLSSGMAHSSASNLKSSSLGNPLLQPESVSSWPNLWSQAEGWLCSALPSLAHQWAAAVGRWAWGALVEGTALTSPVSYSVLSQEWGVSHSLHFLQNHTQRASIPCSRSQSL